MFYRTDDPKAHLAAGLAYNPFKAIVAPRPIGWISSLDADGRPNLAPYSYFNAVHDAPPMVVFSSSGWKDSVRNVEATGEFTCNYVSSALRDGMNASSGAYAQGVDEFAQAGLETVAGETVACPRVKGAAAALECRAVRVVRLETADGEPVPSWLVIGQVTGVYIDEACVRDGRFDVTLAQPITRMGYKDYSTLGEVFEMERPQV